MADNYVITIQPKSSDWKKREVDLDGNSTATSDLNNVNQLVVKQVLSATEAVTGWDKRNKYEIWDGQTGEKIYFAQEDPSSCWIRNCCGQNREFGMPFTDSKLNEIFRLNKVRSVAQPSCCWNCCWSCQAKCCACCGLDTTKPTSLKVVLDGKNKYEVRQVADMPCGRPHFVIVDLTDEKVIYEIQRDELCTSAICCDNVFYYLLDTNGKKIDGYLSKYWQGNNPGCCSWMSECCNASTHVIEFPKSASSDEKAALTGAMILMNFAYYQYKNDG